MEELVRDWSPGSILNSPFANGQIGKKWGWNRQEWLQITDQIQEVYMTTQGGAGVKLFFGIDSVHGATYVQVGGR